MSLHRLTSITIGVPNVAETAQYYAEFGLTPVSRPGAHEQQFTTRDGGEQLTIAQSSTRRLLRIGVGAQDPDDLDRITHSLGRLDIDSVRDGDSLLVHDPNSALEVLVEVAPELRQEPAVREPMNAPGRADRANVRAPGVDRNDRIRPRKLGHVVIGSVDREATTRFFIDGLGFKMSDHITGIASFMRCSTDHHNVLVQQAPLNFLHHTAWEVDDVDEVGRGASSMLQDHPERHVWGLGRHHLGSNFFWYLKDPAGNFSEYYSDLDCIIEDALWKPEDIGGARGLYNWGPPPPPSFLAPEDLAGLMTGSHAPTA
ncbi:VOC family protein [Streptomyces griseorubiginosus]|uniref:VOC family protein n=1 Tax=Streptomyces griseorubiginosus TaxID=67304 RepID=UPI001AD78B81|nr:VOC family protein [Streptomyces griseorubiginosus]MBO4254091.1 dioxygenase [Streptomyces griseorubiginosus]